jgi:multidrug efflux pump
VVAIGIVVDDAIVVVENIERWMAKGLPAREATIKAMEEITGPVIAITLVLSSVFLPTLFIAGIPGKFFQQFALTIAASTIISAINAMTMAPARAVTLIKPHQAGHDREALPNWGVGILGGYLAFTFLWPWMGDILGATGRTWTPIQWGGAAAVVAVGVAAGLLAHPIVNLGLQRFFRIFNHGFEFLTDAYGRWVKTAIRFSVLMLVLYVGLIGLAFRGFQVVPSGFIPQQDKGYLVVNAQLPDGASLQRTEKVAARINEILLGVDGVQHTVSLPGYSIFTSTNSPNAIGMFVVLDPFEHRARNPDQYAANMARTIQDRLSSIQEARIVVIGAPPIDGLASTAGMKMQVQDRSGVGASALQGAVENLVAAGRAEPRLDGSYSNFFANEPQLYVDINREKAKAAGVPLDDLFQTLQVYLGAAYANDITRFGRNWQVNIQADSRFRRTAADIGKLQVRNQLGQMVPLATLVDIRDVSGPGIVYRFNMYPSADFISSPAPGNGTGDAIALMEGIANRELPSSMGFAWTELAFQQIAIGQDVLTKWVFPLAVLFVFLVLAAQYESWSMPFAILLIVPMCLLAAIAGLWLTQSESTIFTQIGLVVLIALAAKNAILIVEFARQLQSEGRDRTEAVVEACRVRLRPILMTSFAFILGVAPLLVGSGAGFEMRRSLGLAVFSGMLGVTAFGLFFTPVFFVIVDWLGSGLGGGRPAGMRWWQRLLAHFPRHASANATIGSETTGSETTSSES